MVEKLDIRRTGEERVQKKLETMDLSRFMTPEKWQQASDLLTWNYSNQQGPKQNFVKIARYWKEVSPKEYAARVQNRPEWDEIWRDTAALSGSGAWYTELYRGLRFLDHSRFDSEVAKSERYKQLLAMLQNAIITTTERDEMEKDKAVSHAVSTALAQAIPLHEFGDTKAIPHFQMAADAFIDKEEFAKRVVQHDIKPLNTRPRTSSPGSVIQLATGNLRDLKTYWPTFFEAYIEPTAEWQAFVKNYEQKIPRLLHRISVVDEIHILADLQVLLAPTEKAHTDLPLPQTRSY